MYYREPEGVTAGESDACQDCQRFEGPCAVVVEELQEVLEAGMHLEVLYCPDYEPPLGYEAKTISTGG